MLEWQGVLNSSGDKGASSELILPLFHGPFWLTSVSSCKLVRIMRPVSTIVEHDPREKDFSHWIKLKV